MSENVLCVDHVFLNFYRLTGLEVFLKSSVLGIQLKAQSSDLKVCKCLCNKLGFLATKVELHVLVNLTHCLVLFFYSFFTFAIDIAFYFKEAVRKAVTDDRAPKLIARALCIQDRKCVQDALLIIKEGCLYPEFQLQKYMNVHYELNNGNYNFAVLQTTLQLLITDLMN